MAETVQGSGLVYLASFAALLGALSVGLSLGYTAPAFNDMTERNSTEIFNPTNEVSRKSWIGSALPLGALVGGAITEPSNNMLGRRLSMLFFGIPFALGWLLIGVAKGPITIIVGRLLTGVCSGLICGVTPTYVVEIAPPKIRGLLGTCFQVMVVVGILFEAVFGILISWKWLAGINVIFALAMSILIYFMPETPQWLLSKGRSEEAEQSLKQLRSSPIAHEFNEMTQTAASNQQSSSSYSCETFTSVQFYKPLILSLALMFFQQFSGINAVLFYQTDVFKSAAPDLNASHATIAVCVAQVIATVIGSSLVDLLGRRMLLIASGLGHTISLIMFGYCKKLAMSGALALISLIIFISSFSIGYGPIPWMMVPELSPAHFRSMIASIATSFNWICVFIITLSVKDFMDAVGDDNTYFIFASICALSCAFVVFFLPETKGKTSEQIQRELLGMRPASQPSAGQSPGQENDRGSKTFA